MAEARSRDIYSRTDELDQQTLAGIAEMLELRGRHPQQVMIRETYLGLLPDWPGRRVVEVGCGIGVVSRELARCVGPIGSVLALDPCPEFVAHAEKLASESDFANLAFALGDARALELPDSSFDVAVAVTVLSHVPGREQILRELHRVVRPGGYALIVDGDFQTNQLAHPDRATTDRIIAAWRAQVVDDPDLARRLGPLMDDAGFERREVRGHVHVELGRVDQTTSFRWQWALFALKQARSIDAVSEAEADDWLDALRALHDAGGFFGSVNFVSVLARRP